MRQPLAPKALHLMLQADIDLQQMMLQRYGWRLAGSMRGRPVSEQTSADVRCAMIVCDEAMKAYVVAVETDSAIERMLTI